MSDALRSALRAVTGGRLLSREEARSAADAIGARSEWKMCEPGYGHYCPVSPLDSLANVQGKVAISYRLPRSCLTSLAGRPSDLGGSHVVVMQPAKRGSCASNFAVELWMNEVGQVTSVNLLLSR